MKKLISSYIGPAICFIATIFIIKITELCLTLSSNANTFASNVVTMVTNCIPIGMVLLVALLFACILFKISHRLAINIATFILCNFALLEMGLCIYTYRTGILMGKELFIRPMQETLATIVSAISVWHIVGVLLFVVLFFVTANILSKHLFIKLSTIIVMVWMIISIPLFFVIYPSPNNKNVNKTWRCVRSCIGGIVSISTDSIMSEHDNNTIDNLQVNRYRELFPERCSDKAYLLERKNNIPNVLEPYFKKKSDKPNIVLIIVESLGSDSLGYNVDNISFMPFLDSLSKKSLFWSNCLATTPRSFGAVPAVTGSVPHGLKGFQFGEMPTHNSLFTVAKSNNYKTNAFYAGNYSFDRIYDYLVAQQIDYMSPYYEEFKSLDKNERDGTYWGYNDDVMLQKGIEETQKRSKKESFLDLYVTISQHEDLQLKDQNLQQKFYEEASRKVSQLSNFSKSLLENKIGVLASTLYADYSLKHFFEEYRKLPVFENTIFIITGDHSMNFNITNALDPYHVPLIIYSPLLTTNKEFPSVVSHLDITPSLIALLSENFDLKSPEYVHWVNDGLDTNSTFRSKNQNYFLRYSREVSDGILGEYYFSMDNGEKSVYKIDKTLNLHQVDDKSLVDSLYENFKTLLYVDNYVYSNNLLSKKSLLHKTNFTPLFSIILDSVYCASPQERPSIAGKRYADIFKESIPCKSNELKIQIEANLLYTGNVWQDQFIYIVFECNGDKMSTIFSEDFISKYIQEKSYQPNKWYKMKFTKNIVVNQSNLLDMAIYLSTTHKDEFWEPSHTILLKNVKMQIWSD